LSVAAVQLSAMVAARDFFQYHRKVMPVLYLAGRHIASSKNWASAVSNKRHHFRGWDSSHSQPDRVYQLAERARRGKKQV
jgi:hypothetical protein